MPARSSFDYAVIRVVPRVEREEFLNAGVILFCRTRRFLGARVALNRACIAALAPTIDLDALEEQLAHIPMICAGGRAAGPIGALPQPERFHWLTTPRSAIIQPSPIHCGTCTDPAAALEHLMEQMVLPITSLDK